MSARGSAIDAHAFGRVRSLIDADRHRLGEKAVIGGRVVHAPERDMGSMQLTGATTG
jgi:hypothetical protein